MKSWNIISIDFFFRQKLKKRLFFLSFHLGFCLTNICNCYFDNYFLIKYFIFEICITKKGVIMYIHSHSILINKLSYFIIFYKFFYSFYYYIITICLILNIFNL